MDGAGHDLRFYEDSAGDNATIGVWGSSDGLSYIMPGSEVTSFGPDLSGTGLSRVADLQFVGLGNAGTIPGWDLDAVEALHSPPVPIPGALWLFGSGLAATGELPAQAAEKGVSG
ncbi:MAG: hypothetical protein P1P84_11815 [Deferrisomatales bacterium]|nr:hypothetical protein [Deferrisomatales bacterium]